MPKGIRKDGSSQSHEARNEPVASLNRLHSVTRPFKPSTSVVAKVKLASWPSSPSAGVTLNVITAWCSVNCVLNCVKKPTRARWCWSPSWTHVDSLSLHLAYRYIKLAKDRKCRLHVQFFVLFHIARNSTVQSPIFECEQAVLRKVLDQMDAKVIKEWEKITILPLLDSNHPCAI